MKKLFILITALLINLSVYADDFKEGIHYQELYTPVSASPTVTEFFSFYCPHCRNFEPIIKKLKTQLPDSVSFEQRHITFMGKEMGIPMAKAYATMSVLKLTDTLVPKMFKQIQVLRNPPKDEAELRQWFISQGVAPEKFDETYNSFIVDTMLNRFTTTFKESQLRGVPGIVVNNKYVVLTNHLKSYDEYIDLVKYLINK